MLQNIEIEIKWNFIYSLLYYLYYYIMYKINFAEIVSFLYNTWLNIILLIMQQNCSYSIFNNKITTISLCLLSFALIVCFTNFSFEFSDIRRFRFVTIKLLQPLFYSHRNRRNRHTSKHRLATWPLQKRHDSQLSTKGGKPA